MLFVFLFNVIHRFPQGARQSQYAFLVSLEKEIASLGLTAQV